MGDVVDRRAVLLGAFGGLVVGASRALAASPTATIEVQLWNNPKQANGVLPTRSAEIARLKAFVSADLKAEYLCVPRFQDGPSAQKANWRSLEAQAVLSSMGVPVEQIISGEAERGNPDRIRIVRNPKSGSYRVNRGGMPY